jgi:ubiquinone/menaquinone biosynthesis C-methylase UbiE
MDKSYWKSIYSRQTEDEQPSLFAKFVSETIGVRDKRIIELGCGNGRDAIHFANNNAQKVDAVDQCENIIELLQHRYQRICNLTFLCRDFTNMKDMANHEKYDLVYSRFTLHSISKNQERQVVEWAFQNLNHNGTFCIEVRGQKNEIFRAGEPVKGEPDAFILNNHFRRFIHFETFCKELESIGFHIAYAEEKKGFAPYNGEDETYIRIVANR